jgi:hypothetical protein
MADNAAMERIAIIGNLYLTAVTTLFKPALRIIEKIPESTTGCNFNAGAKSTCMT